MWFSRAAVVFVRFHPHREFNTYGKGLDLLSVPVPGPREEGELAAVPLLWATPESWSSSLMPGILDRWCELYVSSEVRIHSSLWALAVEDGVVLSRWLAAIE